jgi:DNA polymerase I-like protein with 3'-5' exonuclease and polymerase domains
MISPSATGDTAMQDAYRSGDCYLAFAKQAGAVPEDATKQTHGPTRELFKQCTLAVQYGMEAPSLALRIAQPQIVARDLLRAHRETYCRFWAWSDAALDQAMLLGVIHTVFGWPVRVGERSNPRSLRNFPMQANGAEMLRIACCLATERGVEVCAPIHDALLICAPLERLEADVAMMRTCMAEASRLVLAGFELATDVKATKWPDRYSDPRGVEMWKRVCGLVMADQTAVQGAA